VATCSFVRVSGDAWRGRLRGPVVVFLLSPVGCFGACGFRQSFLEQSGEVSCIVSFHRRGLVADLEFADVGQGHGTRVLIRWIWDPGTPSTMCSGFCYCGVARPWCVRGDVVGFVVVLLPGVSSPINSRTGRKRMGLGLWALAHCCWLSGFGYTEVLFCVLWACRGLMAVFVFWMVYLWQALLSFASSFVHPFEVLGESTSVIGLSHVPLDRLRSFLFSHLSQVCNPSYNGCLLTRVFSESGRLWSRHCVGARSGVCITLALT
jgi:hypothetical protein